MRRFLKAASWTVTLAWLADLEWRSRRQWAAAAGIRTEQALLREDLGVHEAKPHAAYLIGQLPSIDLGILGSQLPEQPHRLGMYGGLPLLSDPSEVLRHTSV